MLLGIDHLVVAVTDPDAAAAGLLDALGLAATGGGRHDSGTFNRLVFLGDAYLELIGVWDRGRAAAHPIGAAVLALLDAGREGLATFALATDGLRRQAAALHAAGSPLSPPQAGSRVGADGSVTRWQAAFPPDLGPARPPFLIEHELVGPEWGDEARRARAALVHPFGGTARLVGLELAVADPPALASEYESVVGVRVPPGPGAAPGEREALVGVHRIRLVLPPPGPAEAPAARVGIAGTAGPHVVVDRFGVRFARL